MHPDPQPAASFSPEQFVVRVFSEFSRETVQRRWHAINVIVRMSMLAGLDLQLEPALNLICDMAAEIIPYDRGLVYFWDEDQQHMHLRVTRNLESPSQEAFARGNLLNFWTAKFQRPLIAPRGAHAPVDMLLDAVGANSVLVVPLFVRTRVLGSLQLFGPTPNTFSEEDAQLLWILSLVAETLLTRDYANEALIKFAFTDFLTGMKTRGYFETQLEREIKRAERSKGPLALVMIDIDHFKNLNDSRGHHVGDVLLRDLSSILMKDMRQIDTVARYGGEEFVVILPETNNVGAYRVAQRLRKAVEGARFFAGSPLEVVKLTISLGVAVFPHDAQFKRDLIEAADAALYEAKRGGRNRVALCSELENKKEVS
ncbi:MAG: sensor domain-containing diguanylate cyclase [Candidatus Korobacteraceae bacterium]|jgi:diguanylate cyclase (GGDEF)-like protein